MEQSERVRFFRIGDHGAELISAMPHQWMWMDGHLELTAETASGKPMADLEICIPDMRIQIPGEDGRELRALDLEGAFVKRRHVRRFSFEQAGLDRQIEFPMSSVIPFCANLVRKGYRGCLRFYEAYKNNNRFDNPARCDIRLSSWQGAPAFNEAGFQPARIKAEWNPKFGGSLESVAPIMTACERLGLEEYRPTPIGGPLTIVRGKNRRSLLEEKSG